eukprot:EC692321.1.p1 GENE.EC692321.1~~EC692321.1.p1  ORF type:complete len:159 (+),score=48.02 EC692321.1:134-610(+)
MGFNIGALMDEVWRTAPTGALIFGSYLTFLVLGSWLLPGKTETGVEIGTKKRRLEYKFNGLLLHLLSLSSFVAGAYLKLFPGTIIYDNFAGLLFVVNLFAVAQTLFLYIKGKFFSTEAAEYGLQPESDQGILMDLWMGWRSTRGSAGWTSSSLRTARP